MGRNSLSSRLLAWIIPTALGSLLLMAAAAYWSAKNQIVQDAQREVFGIASNASDQAAFFLRQQKNGLATIAQSPLFKDHYMNVEYGLGQEAEVYRREIEKMLLDFSRRSGDFLELRYLDASGREICRVKDNRIDPPAPDRVFEIALPTLRSGRTYVSYARSSGVPMVRYGAPFLDDARRLRGTLVVDCSLKTVNLALKKLTVGSSGRTLLTQGGGENVFIPAGRNPADFLIASVVVPGTPWSVVSVAGRAELLDGLNSVSTATLFLALCLSIIMILIIAGYVRRAMEPVKKLVRAAESYAQGNLDARVRIRSPQEIAALADAFNAMADSLKERTQAIIVSETRYRTATENSPNAVIGLDNDLRILSWNREAGRIFGYPAAEARGRTLSFLFEPEVYKRLAAAMRGGVLRDIEASGLSRDGQKPDLSVNSTEQDGGAGREWFVVIQNLTEKKRLQSQLLQSEKMSAIGTLIAGVAHELNNPLAAVVGFAELLKNLPARAEEREDLRHMHMSALRCRDIVQGLLLFARHGKPIRRRLSLNRAAQTTLELFEYRLAKTEGIRLDIDLDPGQPQVAGDFQKLQQVLVNLLANAADSLAGRLEPRSIRLKTVGGPDGSSIIIEDTGAGVPAPMRERVFDPFYTTKPAGKGTGLGLAISAQIIAELGGTMRCEEATGGGARFVIELPPCPPDAGQVESSADLPPPTAGQRVLVVDDEPHVAQLMKRLLEHEGLLPTVAVDPKEALRLAAQETFDLVIADVDLGAIKGTELLKAVRERPGKTGFMFVTGDILNQGLMYELSALDVPLLAKPFLRADFLRLVRQILAPQR